MSTPRPLGFSHAQFVLIMQGAHQVRVEWRSRFLRSVIDQLTGREVDDAVVARAVEVAVARMSGAAA